MATPFLMMVSREPTKEEGIQTLIGFEENNNNNNKPTEREKRKGKKTGKSKSPSKKKPPQRGMGVEQLERLRLQERWKKLTEIDPVHPLTPQTQFQSQIPHSFSVPFGSSPVVSNGSNGVYGPGWNRFMMLQKVGNNGGFGCNGVGGSGSVLDRVQVDPFKNIGGVSDPRFGNIGRNVLLETPKELSSIQMMQSVSDSYDFGYKKKRTNAESSAGLIKGGRDHKFVEALSMVNGSLGLNLGNNGRSINDQIRNFNNAKAASRADSYRDKEVEVMAVHRNESSSVGGSGSIVLEYEFLSSNNRSHFLCPNEPAVGGHDTSNNNDDTSIDLSLKL